MIFVTGISSCVTFSANNSACLFPLSVRGTSALPQTNPCAFQVVSPCLVTYNIK